MDLYQADIFNTFREAEKYFLLSIRSQYFLIKLIRLLSSFLFCLSIFVIVWLLLFSFSTHPDDINCKAIKNIYYLKTDEISSNLGFKNYYDIIKKENQNPFYLNQTIKCSKNELNYWSCVETYIHNSSSLGQINLVKNNMNYFELTEYLNLAQKNAFANSYLLNCAIHFKTIDRLFDCWFKFTCDYKVFIILHSILFELGMHYFICATLKEQDIILSNQNNLINFQISLLRNYKAMNILKYCQSLLILINGLTYLLYGILPLTLPFAYFIINVFKKDRFYVDCINLIIILLKYLLFLLKSTKFFVAE